MVTAHFMLTPAYVEQFVRVR